MAIDFSREPLDSQPSQLNDCTVINELDGNANIANQRALVVSTVFTSGTLSADH